MDDTLQVGQIVRSKAGRDKDRFFIVVGFKGDDCVYLADGDLRKAQKPKLKNIKHIAKTNNVSNNIIERLEQNTALPDQLLRDELKQWNYKNKQKERGAD